MSDDAKELSPFLRNPQQVDLARINTLSKTAMECSGSIYNAAGEREDVKIFVPINGTNITSSEMVSSVSVLQRHINKLLTNKIESNASVIESDDEQINEVDES
ncbi:hypothetical protein ACTXT7_009593 [Hymenolepis weldensis]